MAMKMTNKIIVLLMTALLAVAAVSCRKRSINGDLDGDVAGDEHRV